MDEKNLTTAPATLEEGEISALLAARKFRELKEKLGHLAPQDLATLLEELPTQEQLVVFRLLGKEAAAAAFVELPQECKQAIVEGYTDRELADILNELYLDDTVDLIEEMPANIVRRILRASDPANRQDINRLLHYPKDSAGTIMTTEYVRFRADMTVEEALEHIRAVAIDKETIYTCYVTTPDRQLIGIVTAKTLLISSLTAKLADIMERDVIAVHTDDDKEDVAKQLEKYDFLAIPVVDTENRLVGIVTVDDAIDVLSRETEEDFAKMAAMTPNETPYLKTPVRRLYLARVPWLMLLMISATFSSMILGVFETALPAVLVLFVPMLMDSGGNSGSQASVTVIRGISLGEVTYRDLLRVLFKELRVGLCCGLTLGTVAFAKVLLVDHLLMHNPTVSVTVALAVALSLCLTVLIAKMVGALLPIIAKRIGLDPAVIASPFLTTIVDVLSLLLYFVIASRVFGL